MFRSSIVGKEVLPPPDLERIFGLTGGKYRIAKKYVFRNLHSRNYGSIFKKLFRISDLLEKKLGL